MKLEQVSRRSQRRRKTRSGEDGFSASRNIYETVKCEILQGAIPPGTLLSEQAMGDRFGVSRTPVRQALGLLSSEGLTTTLARRGHIVRTVSLSELRDAFQLRELLEVEAAGLAATRVSPEDIQRLKEVFNASSGDKHTPMPHKEFHTIIARASGNRLLAESIEQILLLLQQVMILDDRTSAASDDSYSQEHAVIAALEAHDAPAARQRMQEHIRSALVAILGMHAGRE